MINHCNECEDLQNEIDYLLELKSELRAEIRELSAELAQPPMSHQPPMSRERFRQEAVLMLTQANRASGFAIGGDILDSIIGQSNKLTAAVFDGGEK